MTSKQPDVNPDLAAANAKSLATSTANRLGATFVSGPPDAAEGAGYPRPGGGLVRRRCSIRREDATCVQRCKDPSRGRPNAAKMISSLGPSSRSRRRYYFRSKERGTGAQSPGLEEEVAAHYTGWLADDYPDGIYFDSSRRPGNPPRPGRAEALLHAPENGRHIQVRDAARAGH